MFFSFNGSYRLCKINFHHSIIHNVWYYACIIFSDLNSGKAESKPTSNRGGNTLLAEGKGELLLHGRSKVLKFDNKFGNWKKIVLVILHLVMTPSL